MKKISLLSIFFFVLILSNTYAQKYSGNGMESNNTSNAAIKLSVYPNPASGRVFVSFNSETSMKYTISVVDMIGRVKFTESIFSNEGSNQKQIDLENFVKGLYMIVIHTDGRNDQATRLIVE